MNGIQNLTNAALEFIEERSRIVDENPFGDYGPLDVDSVLRERHCIEQEITAIERLMAAARIVARTQYPSVERLLRSRGFGVEADRIADLVAAIDAFCIEHSS